MTKAPQTAVEEKIIEFRVKHVFPVFQKGLSVSVIRKEELQHEVEALSKIAKTNFEKALVADTIEQISNIQVEIPDDAD